MSSAGVKDLLAIATIRRLILELGEDGDPDRIERALGPLDLWARIRTDELGGCNPIEAIDNEQGRQALANILKSKLSRS